MIRHTTRARGTRQAIAALAAVLFLGACKVNQELLAPQQPSVILPSAVSNATAAQALYVGAINRWKLSLNGGGNNTEGVWNWEALFTDEVRSSDTFLQRNNADQRNLQTNDAVLTPIYQAAQQARGRARDAINALETFDTTATGREHIGEMYLAMGDLEMELSAVFCNGIPFGETVNGQPVYTQPLTDADGSKLAIARFDTALTFLTGTDSGTATIKNAVRVARARAQVDLGDFTGAATTVAAVPTNFQYNFDYSIGTSDNEWWIMGPSVKRYTAGDSVGVTTVDAKGNETSLGQILNAIPFARLNDPRVVVVDTKNPGEDGTSDFFQVNNAGRDDPTPPFTGIDARLIEAEARLQANDFAGMTAILNALRASPQTIGVLKIPATLPPLAIPADMPSAINLFFREKALWQFERGYRMDDLRRLVRQYGRSQDQVFPSGGFTRNGTPSGNYGTQVAFPVPDAELSNPNFHGCIDTKA